MIGDEAFIRATKRENDDKKLKIKKERILRRLYSIDEGKFFEYDKFSLESYIKHLEFDDTNKSRIWACEHLKSVFRNEYHWREFLVRVIIQPRFGDKFERVRHYINEYNLLGDTFDYLNWLSEKGHINCHDKMERELYREYAIKDLDITSDNKCVRFVLSSANFGLEEWQHLHHLTIRTDIPREITITYTSENSDMLLDAIENRLISFLATNIVLLENVVNDNRLTKKNKYYGPDFWLDKMLIKLTDYRINGRCEQIPYPYKFKPLEFNYERDEEYESKRFNLSTIYCY